MKRCDCSRATPTQASGPRQARSPPSAQQVQELGSIHQGSPRLRGELPQGGSDAFETKGREHDHANIWVHLRADRG
jgi:hypothetical protein